MTAQLYPQSKGSGSSAMHIWTLYMSAFSPTHMDTDRSVVVQIFSPLSVPHHCSKSLAAFSPPHSNGCNRLFAPSPPLAPALTHPLTPIAEWLTGMTSSGFCKQACKGRRSVQCHTALGTRPLTAACWHKAWQDRQDSHWPPRRIAQTASAQHIVTFVTFHPKQA